MKNEHKKLCLLVTNEKINNAWPTMASADGGICLYNLTHMTFAPKPNKKTTDSHRWRLAGETRLEHATRGFGDHCSTN